MYGVVTRNEEETRWDDFGTAFYEVKEVSGRSSEPVAGAVSSVSCFADNAAAEERPELAAVNPEGQPATPDRAEFDWAHICPTHEGYREGLLEIVADCAEVSPDVRLDDVGLPGADFCYCDRCNERFEAWARKRHDRGDGPPPEETTVGDRRAWRASVLTGFVESAAARIPGRTYLTLYPDPYEGRLYERSGIDLDAVAPHVDEFVVPLYDPHYATTYWLEALAGGFQRRLEAPFSAELYAVDVDIDDLIGAVEAVEEYAETVLFGYDAANGRAALRRRRATERDGVEW
jgi:hypothetical protein